MGQGDAAEDGESFQMTLSQESVDFLQESFPDQLNLQESVRAAISEVRSKRMIELDADHVVHSDPDLSEGPAEE